MTNSPEILIVSSARSGSNLLTSMIAASNKCLPFGEVFKPDPSDAEIQYVIDIEMSRLPSQNKAFSDAMRNCLRLPVRDRLTSFRATINASYDRSVPAASYKLFAEHLYHKFSLVDGCAHVIKGVDRTCPLIILYRNDLRLMYLSMMRAISSGNWLGGKTDDRNLPEISIQSYLNWRDWVTRTWALTLDLLSFQLLPNKKVLTLDYESIQTPSDQHLMCDKLSEFIFDRPTNAEWHQRLPFEVPLRQSAPNVSKSSWSEELISHLPPDNLSELLIKLNPTLLPLLL